MIWGQEAGIGAPEHLGLVSQAKGLGSTSQAMGNNLRSTAGEWHDQFHLLEPALLWRCWVHSLEEKSLTPWEANNGSGLEPVLLGRTSLVLTPQLYGPLNVSPSRTKQHSPVQLSLCAQMKGRWPVFWDCDWWSSLAPFSEMPWNSQEVAPLMVWS